MKQLALGTLSFFLFSNWYKYMNDRAVPLDDLLFVATWSRIRRLFLIPPRIADESGVRWTETAQDPWQRGEATVAWPILAMPNQSLDEIGGLTCVICVHPLMQKMGLLFALISHQVYKRLRFTIKLNPVSSKKKSFTSKLSKLSKLDRCHHICPSTASHLCQICLDPIPLWFLKFIAKIFESLRNFENGHLFPNQAGNLVSIAVEAAACNPWPAGVLLMCHGGCRRRAWETQTAPGGSLQKML